MSAKRIVWIVTVIVVSIVVVEAIFTSPTVVAVSISVASSHDFSPPWIQFPF